MTTTPWGKARPIAQTKLAQRAGQRRFATIVELLETDDGERLVRIAYSTDGVARRGPVTLRERDLARLRSLLAGHPELWAALVGPQAER